MNFPVILLIHFLSVGLLNFATSEDVLKIVTIESPPFVHLKSDKSFEGFLIDLIDELQQSLDFKYELYLVPDGKFGKQNPRGQWSGIVGEVINRRANMSLAPLTITYPRERVVDFTIPYMHMGITVLYKRPAKGEKLPFHNIESLVGHEDDIYYGVLKDGSTHEFFQNNGYRLYREMVLGQIIKNDPSKRLIDNITQAVAKVKNGSFAFIGEYGLLKHFAEQTPCDLVIVSRPIQTPGYALAFPSHYERLEDFNNKILQLQEDGTLHRLEKKWWKNKCQKRRMCICEETDSGEKDRDEEKYDEDE